MHNISHNTLTVDLMDISPLLFLINITSPKQALPGFKFTV